ncbi:hypothetical protein TIFTF001_004739 [Ficus carica]|uniref:Exonuclease domain-containing protein n=1 Tax=Ficus carica TaxID=3494 RepID=A0AA88CTN7_FICCA|nr:hypothetical protein TIFTF001_004739 [Ficus carica]
MDDLLATTEKKALVEIVKLVQKRGWKGSKGDWKEFLKFYDKKIGASLSDPARRSTSVLIAFLKTFDKEDHLQFLAKVIQSCSKRNMAQQVTGSLDDESPEQRLVRLTLEHPLYPLEYSFPSSGPDWVVTELGKKSKVMRSDRILAVDCEMVLCVDGTEALVKVCVVNHNLKVKLDEIVRPNKAVADYRTEITGITAADLEGVMYSLADVQSLLGYELRKKDSPHNCLDDACAAMKLVIARLKNQVEDTIPLTEVDVRECDTSKLFLHKIPVYVPSEELLKVMPGDFTIELKPSWKFRGNKYSAYAIFKNSQEAEQAYEDVRGTKEKDSFGRPQKLITLKLSNDKTCSIYVRKMVHGDDLEGDVSRKRADPVEETSNGSKKLKIDENVKEETMSDQDHHEEIEVVKKERKARDSEIFRESGKASKHRKDKIGKILKTDENIKEETMTDQNECSDQLEEIEVAKKERKAKDTEISRVNRKASKHRKDKKGKKKRH